MKTIPLTWRALGVALVLSSTCAHAQNNLGIGTASPDASALVEMQATNKGLLVPRMSEATRASIAAPAKGLLVFQTDGPLPGFWYNAGDNVTKNWAFVPNITSNGLIIGDGSIRVGIGTSTPRGLLDVSGGDTYLVQDVTNGNGQAVHLPGNTYLAPNAGSGSFANVEARGASSVGLRLRTTNNNTMVEALQFQANGNAVFAGSVTATSFTPSDQRLKQNIRPLGGALAAVQLLRGVRYQYRQDIPERNLPTGEQVGVIAQEVEKLYPELVNTSEDGYKAVNYAQLTPILLEAIKEQQQQIEALKKRADRAEASFGQRLQALEAASPSSGHAQAHR